MTDDHLIYHNALNRDRQVHIVDGDVATCQALSLLFRLEGFQTTFSMDAAQFYAVIEHRRPDVVLLNLQMGGSDGLALLRRIKTLHTGTPVFMLADGPSLDAAVMAMKLGAADVVSKPIDNEN